MGKENKKLHGWKDVVEITISLWMLVAPLALGYFVIASASATSIFLGTIIFFISQLGLAKQQPWEEWVVLILALLLILSPWLFGYAHSIPALLNASICGGLLIVFSVFQMIEEYSIIRHGGTTET